LLLKVGVPVTDGSIGPGHGTVMSGGQVPATGPPRATVKFVWQVFRTPPPKSRMTRMVTDPPIEVITVTWQACVATHVCGPTNVAPALLLIKDHVALKVWPTRNGEVAM